MYFKMLDILKELKQVLSYMIPVIGGAGRAVIPACTQVRSRGSETFGGHKAMWMLSASSTYQTVPDF